MEDWLRGSQSPLPGQTNHLMAGGKQCSGGLRGPSQQTLRRQFTVRPTEMGIAHITPAVLRGPNKVMEIGTMAGLVQGKCITHSTIAPVPGKPNSGPYSTHQGNRTQYLFSSPSGESVRSFPEPVRACKALHTTSFRPMSVSRGSKPCREEGKGGSRQAGEAPLDPGSRVPERLHCHRIVPHC